MTWVSIANENDSHFSHPGAPMQAREAHDLLDLVIIGVCAEAPCAARDLHPAVLRAGPEGIYFIWLEFVTN